MKRYQRYIFVSLLLSFACVAKVNAQTASASPNKTSPNAETKAPQNLKIDNLILPGPIVSKRSAATSGGAVWRPINQAMTKARKKELIDDAFRFAGTESWRYLAPAETESAIP